MKSTQEQTARLSYSGKNRPNLAHNRETAGLKPASPNYSRLFWTLKTPKETTEETTGVFLNAN
jgi:hypothetical protein